MEGRKSDRFYLQLLRYNSLNLLSGLKCKSVNMKIVLLSLLFNENGIFQSSISEFCRSDSLIILQTFFQMVRSN